MNVLQIAILQYRMGRTTGIVQLSLLISLGTGTEAQKKQVMQNTTMNHSVKYTKSKCMFSSSTAAASLFVMNF